MSRRSGNDTMHSIAVLLYIVIIALVPETAHSKADRMIMILMKGGQKIKFALPSECGLYGKNIFCMQISLCNKHCPHRCSRISSFELRNLNILTEGAVRIQELSFDEPLDTNLRINYFDVEMRGMKPAFCGNYSTLEMPIYSVPESKSNFLQFLTKLYIQKNRDVYTHSECNNKCIFGCRQVGYDEGLMSELLHRNLPDLHVYQCDSIHAWVFFVILIIVFIAIMSILSCVLRSRISKIRDSINSDDV